MKNQLFVTLCMSALFLGMFTSAQAKQVSLVAVQVDAKNQEATLQSIHEDESVTMDTSVEDEATEELVEEKLMSIEDLNQEIND